ncbi:hypothetical protein CEUSTIGMA_g4662.t1 [Chlamydomonas eustigma]|uniref:Peptidase metallopeptidase domain-containing protein n=1 Tax=Chlamydomonas eustigma TaxID=1157962 RepID=A0A250X2D7_9CHLO|nr:hypothetical protein CEUSTIGMA_g4662.t1 [Chlamydomonas eustigma]|eukprot:GAX77216.1 hypothetical protein CEUSTIGMA_g4662.t1 [Chlamydomonas eustigma]
MLGITVDGMAGPETKAQMLCARHDSNEADVNFGLMSDDEGKAVYQMGQVVRWWCGPAPSYLSQSQVQKELGAAFSQWAEAVPLHFLQTDHPQNCDLALSWADHSPDHEFKFSGPGSTLAVTENRCVTFELSEMWLFQGQRPRIHPSGGHLYPSFYFLPVLLHELCHALGLRHSELPGDVMAPYYHAGKVKLSRNDLGRSLLLYPLHRISSLAFKALDPGPGGLVSKQDMKQVLMQRGMEPLSEIEFELLWKRVHNGRSGLTHSHFAAISHQQFVLLLSGLFTSSSFRSV